MLPCPRFDAFLTHTSQLSGVAGEWCQSGGHRFRWGSTAMLQAFIDSPMRHGDLTVFPVISPHGPVLPFLLSTDIQDEGVLTVREKPGEGPPRLLVRNNSLHHVLALAGEPLPDGDRGRWVERSILLAGKSVTQIPASGKEIGGWAPQSLEAEITEWLQDFPLLDDQVGALAFLGDRLLGLEALGAGNLYGPLHRRLLIRFIREALKESGPPGGEPARLDRKAQDVLDALGAADRVATERIGVGEGWSLSGPISGEDLVFQGHLIHLSVRSTGVGMATSKQSEGGR